MVLIGDIYEILLGMSLIEIDTGVIFSGYLDYGIMYKTRSIDGIEKLAKSAFERPQWS